MSALFKSTDGTSQANGITEMPAVGWHEKDHKPDCKILRDTDMARMFSVKWDCWEGYFCFPRPQA